MNDAPVEPAATRGLPIVAHLALLVAMALAAAYLLNIAAVVMLPPRPPDVVRGDKVLNAFVTAYEGVKQGRTPRSGDGARWEVADTRPRAAPGPRPGRLLTRDLARRLEINPRNVIVAFDPTPSDVLVFRVRREEMRVAHDAMRAAQGRDAAHERHGGPRERTQIIIEERIGAAPAPPAPPPSPPQAPAAPEPPLFAPPPPGVVLMSGFMVAAELPDGRWLTMRQQSNAETLDWIMRAALGIGVTLVILLLLALLFARRLAAPIQRLAASARRVGDDPAEAPVREEGPRELRTAARAVNAMQARLRALVAERTEMLAAVAHDLRTPLMRMRLVAENADPAVRDRLVKEAVEIDALVSSFIAFARDDPTREPRIRLDLAALVQSLADDRAEAGQAVSYEGPDRLVITGQQLGLKRLIDNLVDNALKYGVVARVAVRLEDADAVIEVSDDGPGVAPEERERVFRPFVRGETAGQQAAGAGLGLSAAREIARAHGGDVEIRDGRPNGALIRVNLPV